MGSAPLTAPHASRFAPAALLALAGCGVPELAAPRAVPRFDALAFFAGASSGTAELRRLFARRVAVRVESHGRVDGGELVLDQAIREGSKPPRMRRWRIREVAPGRYAGSLTDAIGPVSGDVTGNRLHLAFTMKGGFAVDQWLDLSKDGRRADNIMIVRKLGVRVATLRERIVRAG